MTWVRQLALCAAIAGSACGKRPDPVASGSAAAQKSTAWHRLGSFSGRGNRQTESMTSETGALRVRWVTANAAADGTFRLTAHSAISGRLLQEVVDQGGGGRGEGFVQQDPHVLYFVVESGGLDWEFTVDEAIEYPVQH